MKNQLLPPRFKRVLRGILAHLNFYPWGELFLVNLLVFSDRLLSTPEKDTCLGGGIGRRVRLKIVFRKECGFDSRPRHSYTSTEKPVAER